jgi:hypothetical protein
MEAMKTLEMAGWESTAAEDTSKHKCRCFLHSDFRIFAPEVSQAHVCDRDCSADMSPLSRIIDVIIQVGDALLRVRQTSGCSWGISSADIVIRSRKGPAKFNGRQALELRYKCTLLSCSRTKPH